MMEKQFREKKLKATLTMGEQAVVHLKEAPVSNVYSPLAKRSSILQAKAELINAEIYFRLKNKKQAKFNFENSFQRLSEYGLLVLTPR